MSLTKTERDVIVELYKEFHEDNPRESCSLCCHGFVNENGFWVCGIGNFHQYCGGTNCKEFELSCAVEALFEKIKEYKTQIKEIREFCGLSEDKNDNIIYDKNWQKEYTNGKHREQVIQWYDENKKEWISYIVYSNLPTEQPAIFDENYKWRIKPKEIER